MNKSDVEGNDFEYYSDEDIFVITNNPQKEEIIGSIPLGNIVFDIGSSGKVVGLEVDNASETFNVSQTELSKVVKTRLAVKMQGNILMIQFVINLPNKNYEYSYAIPRNKIAITGCYVFKWNSSKQTY